ncbi:MAG: family 1 glycosylhydrolase, partial [Limisphaerales bacterium]
MGNPSRIILQASSGKRPGTPGQGADNHQTIAELFSPNGGRPIEYVGSATSHFQAEPLHYDDQGNARVSSDWEMELTRLLRGQTSGIPNADTTSLPRFFLRKGDYIRRAAEMRENMFRFSLEFGRLCPREGEFDEDLMTEYIRTLVLIRLGGLCPFLTLHHFTSPKWLIRTDPDGNIVSGAWENRDVTRHFRFYVSQVVRCLADRDRIRATLQGLKLETDVQDKILAEGVCRYFMTLNEPAVLIPNAYLGGLFPPYHRGTLGAARRALNHLVEAHRIAADGLKNG